MIIRYKQFTKQGRNLLVSSTTPLGLLRSMILRRVRDLNLELSDEEYRQLADKFINDAGDISGDIVLRAAKRGRNASELMGIVLSRFLIRCELGPGRYMGWYFLDDYAEWLGQREQHIDDILALGPEKTGDGMRLAIIVSEAKYIDHGSLSAKRKESAKQLRDTVRRIYDALFGDPKRLDRELWFARFSDLVLNGIQFPAGADIDLSVWRRAIREGDCAIFLRGYSHVFVSGPSGCPECSDFTGIANLRQSYQEVFSRQNLRKLVLKYFKDEDPVSIRIEIAGENIWENRDFSKISTGSGISGTEPENGRGDTQAASPVIPVDLESEKEETPGNETPEKSEPTEDEKQTADSRIHSDVGKLMEEYEEECADSREDGEWLDAMARQCKGALQQFGLRSKLLEKALTPNAALLKFKGSANLTVEQVLKRRSEMLTTHGLNIISVKPEPGVVSISIARPKRRVLRLLNVWKGWTPAKNNFRTPGNHEIPVGLKEDDGNLLCFSPKDNAPHTLIAGSTGSGKSVLMQNIILAIACTNTPEQAKITLIDPKLGVDYFAFENLPHIRGGKNSVPFLSTPCLHSGA